MGAVTVCIWFSVNSSQFSVKGSNKTSPRPLGEGLGVRAFSRIQGFAKTPKILFVQFAF
jgi:hypothetical protein